MQCHDDNRVKFADNCFNFNVLTFGFRINHREFVVALNLIFSNLFLYVKPTFLYFFLAFIFTDSLSLILSLNLKQKCLRIYIRIDTQ